MSKRHDIVIATNSLKVKSNKNALINYVSLRNYGKQEICLSYRNPNLNIRYNFPSSPPLTCCDIWYNFWRNELSSRYDDCAALFIARVKFLRYD